MKKVIACLLLCVMVTAGCAQNPGRVSTEAVHTFAGSVSMDYGTGNLTFTIPENIPEGCEFTLLVAGRLRMGDGEMSVHPFAREEAEGWEPGGTYTHTFGEGALVEATLLGALVQKGQSLAEVEMEFLNGGREQIHTFWSLNRKGDLAMDEERTRKIYD